MGGRLLRDDGPAMIYLNDVPVDKAGLHEFEPGLGEVLFRVPIDRGATPLCPGVHLRSLSPHVSNGRLTYDSGSMVLR